MAPEAITEPVTRNGNEYGRTRDPTTKRFGEEFSDEDFIDAIDALGEAGTADVTDALGCSRETARARLHQLADDGQIERRKLAGAWIWKPEPAHSEEGDR